MTDKALIDEATFESLITKLPKEVNMTEAAKIIGCDVRRLKKYIQERVLRARDASLPSSSKDDYRLPLDDVMEFRTSYELRGG